jgi:syntaxin 1B/2/3
MQEIHNMNVSDVQPFQQQQQQFVHIDEHYHDEMMPNFTNPITKSFISESWLIEKELDAILSNISNIQSTQTQIAIATSKRQEISLISSRDLIMDTTRNLLNETKNRIKSLELQDIRINRTSITSEDVELRRQRITHLKEKFVTCLQTYRNIENIYMKQQKERLSRQYKIVYPDAKDEEIDDYLKNPTDQPVFLTNRRSSLNDSKNVLDEVNKRHHDIKKIEQTIAELVVLFEEIQLEVELQDEIIISITDEVKIVETVTREAKVEIEKAEEVVKSSRKFKWLCALFTLIIFSVIILIVILITNKHH